MNHLSLQLDSSIDNGRNSEGAFVTLRDGRIIFAYTKYTTADRHDHAPSVIAARVSLDDGLTWTDQDRVLVDHADALNVMSVSLLRRKADEFS